MAPPDGQGLVFISYAHADDALVRPVVKLLQNYFQIWWDQHIDAGETWRHKIQENLANSKCVVVFWTPESVEQDFVWSECDHAKERGVLVPVLLDRDANIPLGFDQLQYIDLSAWSGDPADARFEGLLSRVTQLLKRPRRSPYTIPLRYADGVVNDAESASNRLMSAGNQLRDIGGILRQGNGPVDDLLVAINQVHATFRSVNEGLETFFAPARNDKPLNTDFYAEIELGAIEDLVADRLGHCSYISEAYLKSDGLRDWLSARVTDTEMEKIDELFSELSDADYTLFERMGNIGRVLSSEADEITNLIIAGQTDYARERIAHSRTVLMPIHKQVRTSMNHLLDIAAKFGHVPQ